MEHGLDARFPGIYEADPYFRKHNHNKMTFGITYSTSENFILVLSHDEVVHLKCSMINKMPGEYEDKFANLKAGYTFMLGHPGKKLLFMARISGSSMNGMKNGARLVSGR